MVLRIISAGLAVAAQFACSAERSVSYDVSRDESDTASAHTSESNWMHYKANEVNFEFFGVGTVGRSSISEIAPDDIERDGNFGPGIGISYFPHRNIGLQAESYHDGSRGDHFVDAVGGHLVGRFPLRKNGLAPYIFGGAGRQFDPGPQWTWDAGGGLEWRFFRHMGAFADGRFVWPDK